MEDRERTLYCGNLSDKVTEDILYELFLQAGPVESVTIPKERDGRPKNFSFIKFKHAVSVQYAVALMNGISLYDRPLRLDPRSNSGEINPYLQKLQEYIVSQQGINNLRGIPQNNSYHQTEDRYQNGNRYRDSRRNEQPLINLNQMNASLPVHGFFPQQYFTLTLPPPPVASTPLMIPNPYQNHGRYDNYRSSRSNYRR